MLDWSSKLCMLRIARRGLGSGTKPHPCVHIFSLTYSVPLDLILLFHLASLLSVNYISADVRYGGVLEI
jgi:hypothetical protein